VFAVGVIAVIAVILLLGLLLESWLAGPDEEDDTPVAHM